MPECETCRYFVAAPRPGMCHRHPATIPVSPADWCGEHRVASSAFAPQSRMMTDDAAHFEKLAAEANRDLVVGGGDSIPPQHRAEYQAELKRLVAPANETLSLQPVAKPGRAKTRTPYQ